MRFIAMKSDDHFVQFRYNTTWNLGWREVLAISQRFLNDVAENVELIEFNDLHNWYHLEEPKLMTLAKFKDFKKEKGGLMIAGRSKIMEMSIRLCLYNQLRDVDVDVRLDNDDLKKAFQENSHILDNYMNSLEILAFMEIGTAEGINLVIDYLHGKDSDKYFDTCNRLDITPYTK